MRIEQGYAIVKDKLTGETTAEYSVFSCAHCSRKVHTTTLRSHQYSICQNCEDGTGRGLICDSPKCNEGCAPHLRMIDDMEARARFRSMI